MISVILKSDLNFTLTNIPDNILSLARGNINEGNGGIIFDVLTVEVVEILRQRIQERLAHPVMITLLNGVYSIKLSQNTANPGPGPVQEDDIERCEHCNNPIDDCDCERCPDCDESIHDCTCRTFRDIEENGSLNSELQAMSNLPRISKNEIPIIIASKLDNDTSSKAKMLADKVVQYNRIFSNLMTLQNEITRLSVMVGAEPLVVKLSGIIDKLIAEDNMVEDIYFTKDYLVVKTKEIITLPLRDGNRRKIGKMEFYFNLNSMFGMRQLVEHPIIIRNKTRESHNMECGHVNLEGLACFGTWTEPILKAFKDYDLEQLIDILIRFIRSPNEDNSMGRPITKWPTVEESQQ